MSGCRLSPGGKIQAFFSSPMTAPPTPSPLLLPLPSLPLPGGRGVSTKKSCLLLISPRFLVCLGYFAVCPPCFLDVQDVFQSLEADTLLSCSTPYSRSSFPVPFKNDVMRVRRRNCIHVHAGKLFFFFTFGKMICEEYERWQDHLCRFRSAMFKGEFCDRINHFVQHGYILVGDRLMDAKYC